MEPLIVAVTGHRPKDLYYSGSPLRDAEDVRHLFRSAFQRHLPGPLYVITGMALGVDQHVAEVCIELGIPFTAAVPFPTQDGRWPEEQRARYKELLSKAEVVVSVSPVSPESTFEAALMMQKRNEWMVDRALKLYALHSGKQKGGTWNCIKYAEKRKILCENLWPTPGYVFPARSHPF